MSPSSPHPEQQAWSRSVTNGVVPADLRLTPQALVRAYPTLLIVDVDAQGLLAFGARRVDRLLAELAGLARAYRRGGGGVMLFAGTTSPDTNLLARMGLAPGTPCLRWQTPGGGLAAEAFAALPPPPHGLAVAGLYLYHCVAQVAASLWQAGYDAATVPRACAEVPGVPPPLEARLRAWPRTITVISPPRPSNASPAAPGSRS